MLTVAENGMLIGNQSTLGDKPVVEGGVDVDKGGPIGIVNAAEGTIHPATGTVLNEGDPVVTDNPFITSLVITKDGEIVNSLDAASGLEAVSSLGIQAMTRRADSKLAEAVARRTTAGAGLESLDQPLSLWVDVSGERYKMDGLNGGGEFKADMGYAVLAADVVPAESWTVGAAVQYGTSTLRSSVAGIRSEIDSWGFTLYGVKSFCDGACRLVSELAYTMLDHDVTGAKTALNAKVDPKIYSAGLRDEHTFGFGALKLTPSIGVRVSRLETDAMSVGAVRVDDQDLTFTEVTISVVFSGFEQMLGGWTASPYAKLSYAPTFGDKEIAFHSLSTDVLDANPFQGDFGLRLFKQNLELSADLQLGAGEYDSSAAGGRIGLRYAF